MELRLLGPVEARSPEGSLPLGGRKQRALLAMLALEPNAPVPADRLMEGLWGEHPPASAPKMVQLYVSQLRKLLAGSGAEIVTRGRGYELAVDRDAVDALRFERLVAEAARADGAAASVARDALALWRGPPLHDVADEPLAAGPIRRLEEAHLLAREIVLDEALGAGDHDRAISELDDLIARHPLRERLHELRMLALYRAGRQAEALEAYRHARELLVEEVGVEPGPSLRETHELILRQDPAVAGPRRAARPSPPAARRRRVVGLALAAGALALVAVLAIRALTGDGDLGRIADGGIGVIDPSNGRILDQYRVGGTPGAVTAGAGSIWVANPREGTVSRIDPSRSEVVTIDVGGEPTAIAFGSDSVWVTDGEGRRVAQIDTRTNRVARSHRVGNAPRGVTVAHGAVWVTSATDGRVDRIPLDGGPVRRSTVGGAPTAIAAGDDDVWVVAEQSATAVRLHPRSGLPVRSVPVGNGPAAVAVGADAVWVASREDGSVTRIDARTSTVTGRVSVGGRPGALAIGEDALWVADEGGRAVVEVAPESLRIRRRVAVESTPAALAFADGRVWTATTPSPAGHRGGTLRYVTEPFAACGCIDPVSYDPATWAMSSLVYDGLISYRRSGGAAGSTLVANLATAVPSAQDGGRTYVFELRPGLRFSDGRPVRPSDFRASMERMLRLREQAEIPPYFSAVVGAEACTASRCDLRAGIEADDAARTITIRLTEPDSELMHKLTLPPAVVVPAGTPSRLATTRPLTGTGPYRIARYDPGRRVRIERNPRFASWSQEARPDGFPDAIDMTLSGDTRASVAAVRRGEQDVVPIAGPASAQIAPDQLRALILQAPNRVHVVTAPNMAYLFLNVREPPFDDVRVRRALNYAIDRRRVARSLGGPVVDITCQVVAPGLPGYEPSCPYTRTPSVGGGWSGPDLRRGRDLVARSGTRGARVTVVGFEPFGGTVRYAAAVLRDLGYRARSRVMEAGEYFSYVSDPGNHAQIGTTTWIADWLTASSFVLPPFGCQLGGPDPGANPSRFCDAGVDRLARRALRADGAEANALWARTDRRIVAAAPAVPLVNFRSALLVSDRVGNVQQQPHLAPLLDQMWVR